MTWINTYSRKRFDYKNIKPESIDIRDIAHSLTFQNRFTGHTKYPWSIAQHSLLVAEIVQDDEDGIHALLHDAAEAYIGDINTVLKSILREENNTLDFYEKAIMVNVYAHMGIDYPNDRTQARIKEADTTALYVEAIELLNYNALEEWSVPVNKEAVYKALNLGLLYSFMTKNVHNIENEFFDSVTASLK